MAIGDLIGDLATAYLTPAQRAAQAAKGVQSISGGPIARASDQLPKAAGLAAAAPVVAGQQDPSVTPSGGQSLASAFSNPAQFAAPPPISAPQSLSSLSPVAPTPPVNTPTFPTSQQPASLSDVAPPAPAQASLAPVAQQPVGLDSAFRPTGSGTGSSAIVGRVGADGTPQFSNQPADLASAFGAAPVSGGPQVPNSLADLSPGGRSADPAAPLASLGSASNLGDGVGTFSQGQAGDSQLALTRFQRANDLRNAYQAQDSADLARARASQGAQLGIVRDSSQRLTRSDLASAALDQQAQAGLVQNAASAQKSLEDLRTGQAAANQVRQGQRLEDAFTAATAPNATPEQKQAYQNLTDPSGTNALNRQLTQAKINETNATAQKTAAEANGTSPEAQQKATAASNKAQLDQLEIQRRQSVAAQTAKTLVDQKAGSIDVAREARDLANSISGDERFGDVVGTLNSRIPTVSDKSQDLINRANRLQSLLTLDNLKLMSGVLTDKDIEFLGRIGSGLNVTENGIKGSVQGTKDRLKEITGRLTGKISEYDKANPAQPAAQAQTARVASPAAPSVGSVQQGYVFLGGDPASQSSWRKQ